MNQTEKKVEELGKPLTPKEFGQHVRKSEKTIRRGIRAKVIPTCDPHRPPYFIPFGYLLDVLKYHKPHHV